jgi:hypothetical protein
VVEVQVSVFTETGDPPVGAPVVTPVAADGSTRPVTTTAIRVKLDRYLDPASANRQALCVQSSTEVIEGLEGCVAGLTLRPLYDPVTRTVSYFLETDQTRLAPNTLYRVTLFRADVDTGDFGLRAFDGATLGGIFAVEFTTDVDRPELATESPPTGPHFCGPAPCFAACATEVDETARLACDEACGNQDVQGALGGCTLSGCHRPAEEKTKPPPMGLDLYSALSIQATALGKVAHHSDRGASPQSPGGAKEAFSRPMPIISPGNPGQSYLLYKILIGPTYASDPTLAEGETDRLRTVVAGMPMPLPLGTIGFDETLRLSQWIASGADVVECP